MRSKRWEIIHEKDFLMLTTLIKKYLTSEMNELGITHIKLSSSATHHA